MNNQPVTVGDSLDFRLYGAGIGIDIEFGGGVFGQRLGSD
jgi:hypothetical protein